MLDLQLSNTTVYLEGISLKGSLEIHNPNPELAISYQILPLFLDYTAASPNNDVESLWKKSLITVFPKSGILLRRETEKILMKISKIDEFYSMDYMQKSIRLIVTYSFNNNYNQILRRNGRLHEIESSKLSTSGGAYPVSVEVGVEHLKLRDEIENQIMFGSTLGKETMNISKIQESRQKGACQEEHKEMENIIDHLQIDSKVFEIEEQKSMYSVKSNTQFESSFQGNKNYEHFSKQSINLKNYVGGDEEINENQKKEYIQRQRRAYAKFQTKNTLQVVILAALSAVFFSLGSNLNAFINRMMG